MLTLARLFQVASNVCVHVALILLRVSNWCRRRPHIPKRERLHYWEYGPTKQAEEAVRAQHEWERARS